MNQHLFLIKFSHINYCHLYPIAKPDCFLLAAAFFNLMAEAKSRAQALVHAALDHQHNEVAATAQWKLAAHLGKKLSVLQL